MRSHDTLQIKSSPAQNNKALKSETVFVQICKKKFKTKGDVRYYHRNVQETEKNYECKVCGKNIKNLKYMQRHVKRHENDGTVDCFKTVKKRDLKKHCNKSKKCKIANVKM